MLKRLYIDNFRCFVNFEYKPERKQLLLGANGSGKSSLLDGIRAVKEFVLGNSPGPRILLDPSNHTRWLSVPNQVFEIEGESKGRTFVYRVETTASENHALVRVTGEVLTVDGRVVISNTNGGANLGEGPTRLVPVSARVKDISLVHFAKDYESAKAFLQWIESLYLLQISPPTMDEIAPQEQEFPSENFANIAAVYRRLLQSDTTGNLEFTLALKQTLDSFQALQFEESDAGRRLIARFGSPQSSVGFGLKELSDGQRSLIALYMVLHFFIAKGQTVIIDEPDNFVSVREIQPWLVAAEEAVEDHNGQLILISHHPEILNQWAQEYGLRFFREENGHVRTEKFRTDPDGLLQPSELIARGWENE